MVYKSTKPKRAIELNGSDKILEYPDGDIEEDVLYSILEDATEKALPKGTLVITTREKRVRAFDQDNPEWERATKKYTFSKLLKLYKDIMGEDFKVKSPEQEENEEHIYRKSAFLTTPKGSEDY